MKLARPLENLIDQLQKLPTIGPKTAQRLALFLLKIPEAEAHNLARAIIDAREKITTCSSCGILTDSSPCSVCRDDSRDASVLCVVGETSDVMAIERAGFRGYYFVLNKDIDMMADNAFEGLNLELFAAKLEPGKVKEIVLALNPDIDGEVMSRYLAGVAARYDVKVTRPAHGLPVGGNIEFADEITLRRALEGRREL